MTEMLPLFHVRTCASSINWKRVERGGRSQGLTHAHWLSTYRFKPPIPPQFLSSTSIHLTCKLFKAVAYFNYYVIKSNWLKSPYSTWRKSGRRTANVNVSKSLIPTAREWVVIVFQFEVICFIYADFVFIIEFPSVDNSYQWVASDFISAKVRGEFIFLLFITVGFSRAPFYSLPHSSRGQCDEQFTVDLSATITYGVL